MDYQDRLESQGLSATKWVYNHSSTLASQKVRSSSGGRQGEPEEICQSTPNFQATKSGSGTVGLGKSLPGIPSLHRELGDYPTKDKWRNNKTTMLKNSYKSNESWRCD